MDKTEFLLLLDDLMELDPGTLQGTEHLGDLPAWDSMTVLGFIALVDEKLGITVSAERLGECKTVNDLVHILDGRVVL